MKHLSFLALILAISTSFGQILDFRNYNADNGFTSKYIYEISQSNTGYLYVSTDEGLFRTDGLSFFKQAEGVKLTENLVTSHYLDKNITILGHYQSGISVIKDNLKLSIKNDSLIEAKVTDIEKLSRT